MAKILVVDDDPVVRELLTAVLEEESDHNVIVAANGQEALDRMSESRIDALVCDVNMPVMDGYALVRSVRENPATCELPVLMISAAAQPHTVDPELRVDLLLEKPFDISALLACVTFVLSRVRAGRHSIRVTRRRAAASVERVARASAPKRQPGFGGTPAG